MQVESCGQELELELCRLYGKKSCKKCYGRGYLIFDSPTQFYKYETRDAPQVDNEPEDKTVELKSTPLPMHWADYCDCTKKRMAKAAK